MRGKRFYGFATDAADGITPAHAGKTLYIVCARLSLRQYLVQWDKSAFNFAYP